jgi:hypothetical protein
VGVPGDPTPPVVTPHFLGTLGNNAWYVSNLTVSWSVVDPESIILSTQGCDTKTLSADTTGTTFTCRAESDGGIQSTTTKVLKVDKTAPTAGGTPARPPDANGWYNRPVVVSFSGADATSGLASCSSATYGGPDYSAAVVGGTCRDNAGNVATATVSLKYDATPPSVGYIRTKAWNRSADISWQASPDTRLVEVSRAPGVNGADSSVVYQGTATSFRDAGLTPARKYTYMVTVIDEAALLIPAPAQLVTSPPRLTWTPTKRARYYNVQMVVRGRRVFSAWPKTTSLQLPRTWVNDGRRYRLRPGLYRWYVWPGFGRQAANRYGPRLGGSTFVVSP